ncbi:hypothetical protein FD754_020928 [Muntiacus muntjak]|uniref:Translation elongation factor EF1B beta/delta subunit guanine nucleotide exchange domain-containing protein n=1 Tax=Muntiacus muntjak TaxID=9888 RepID=A0A5N3V475_MUNMU|nr:hypothetical protein FD754_020928 [Muntiacus muntjak]
MNQGTQIRCFGTTQREGVGREKEGDSGWGDKCTPMAGSHRCKQQHFLSPEHSEAIVGLFIGLDAKNRLIGKDPDDNQNATQRLEVSKCFWKNAANTFSTQALGKYGPANVEDTRESGATDSKDDDDIDLFGSDEEEESEEAKRLREECLAQYESKKAKKPALVTKSSILLDECVRSIQADGLVWGSSKLIPCVVEDDKVGTDMLEELITAFDECVQSMDVAAFNKI